MTPEAQRIAIAQARGLFRIMPLKRTTRKGKDDPAGVILWYCDEHHGGAATYAEVPDYPSDLNAIREAILSLPTSDISGKDQISVRRCLGHIRNDPQHWQTWLASAAEMSEAFLRALRLWEE